MRDRRLIVVFGAVVIIGLVAAIAVLTRPAPDPEGFHNPTAIPGAFNASVSITHPPDGSILYAESLFVAGTASAPQTFRVELVDFNGAVIADGIVETAGGGWSLEVPHSYQGDPGEATVRAVPLDEGSDQYDQSLVLLSPLDERPEGAFGTVTFPAVGAEVGGDVIPVEGRASGLPGNALTIELIGDDGAAIDSQLVILQNPYYVDDLPWSVTISPQDYVGSATIHVYFSPPDAETPTVEVIPVVVGSAAG